MTTFRRPARRASRPSQASRSPWTAGWRLPTKSTSMSRGPSGRGPSSNSRAQPNRLAGRAWRSPSRQGLDPRGVGEDEVAAPQGAAVVMPKEVPVWREADQRRGRRPEAGRNGGVAEVKGDEVRSPAVGQTAADVVPGIDGRDGEVAIALCVEGDTKACGAVSLPVNGLAGQQGTEEVMQGHEAFHRSAVSGFGEREARRDEIITQRPQPRTGATPPSCDPGRQRGIVLVAASLAASRSACRRRRISSGGVDEAGEVVTSETTPCILISGTGRLRS